MKRSIVAAGAAAAVAGAIWVLRRPRYSFKGKVVAITGGSRGLGLALARQLGAQGASLALIARDPFEMERAADELNAAGFRVGSWACDVRNKAEVERTIHSIVDRFGRLDVLINNAGTLLVAPMEIMTEDDFREAMAIHFEAPLFATMAALPFLKKNKESRLVNIASIGGRIGVPHMAPYCASKFALAGLSDSLAAELAKDGVRVTTVSPGLMRTGSHFNAMFKGDRQKEFTWFSLALGSSMTSISADRAAHQILAAVRRGQPELTITWQARMAVIAHALFPNTVRRMLSLFNRYLPPPPKSGVGPAAKGWDSMPRAVPGFLTALADRSAERFNEQPPRHRSGYSGDLKVRDYASFGSG